mgnify:CR=1 FL=1
MAVPAVAPKVQFTVQLVDIVTFMTVDHASDAEPMWLDQF